MLISREADCSYLAQAWPGTQVLLLEADGYHRERALYTDKKLMPWPALARPGRLPISCKEKNAAEEPHRRPTGVGKHDLKS